MIKMKLLLFCIFICSFLFLPVRYGYKTAYVIRTTEMAIISPNMCFQKIVQVSHLPIFIDDSLINGCWIKYMTS